MRATRAGRLPPQLTFGGRVPPAVGLLIAITVVLSLAIAFGERHTGSLFELVVLAPASVWRGQVWRLFSWAFIEPSPLGLIFQCLFLYWFGRDLASVWGARRFLTVYCGIAVVAGVMTCLVARLDAVVLNSIHVGGWPLTAAITIAWGLQFPDRVIRIYFIIPIRGYVLAWITVGGTILFAIYEGFARFTPELCAEAAILALLFRGKLGTRWARLRQSWAKRGDARRRKTAERDRAKKREASVHYLRVVESNDDQPPDLPPELDDRLNKLLRQRGKRDRTDDN